MKEQTGLSDEIINKIKSILSHYGAKSIAIFGSYIRGEEKPDSDLDILVRFSEGKSLLELVRIERELHEEIGIKIDLITEKSVNPYIKDRIKEEQKVILE